MLTSVICNFNPSVPRSLPSDLDTTAASLFTLGQIHGSTQQIILGDEGDEFCQPAKDVHAKLEWKEREFIGR